MRPHGQAVKTSPFHGGNPGSNPGGVTIYYLCGGVAQLARACGSYPQCQGFKSLLRYHFYIIIFLHCGYIWAHSSVGRASALQAGGHRFEPYCAHQIRPGSSAG